jgi:hypothetical protein
MRSPGLLIAAVLTAFLLVGHAQETPAEGGVPAPKCTSCARELAASWNYCPWCGVKVLKKSAGIPVRTPKGVVLEFYEGYNEANREKLRQTLDLEAILSGLIDRAIDRMEDVSPEIKTLFKRKLMPQASRTLVPAVLDVLASDEMKRQFPPPENISKKAIDLYYHEEIVGDTATLIPIRAEPGHRREEGTFVLKKRGKIWLIRQIPGMSQW